MQKYIGVKIVEAEPMYRRDAYDKGYYRPSKDEDITKIPNDYGYHVLYEDGYNSWSPAEVFEKAYRPSNPLNETAIGMNSIDYKERFKAEYNQVNERFIRLRDMCLKWDHEGVEGLGFTPTCSRDMYEKQLAIMLDYINILEERALIENIEL